MGAFASIGVLLGKRIESWEGIMARFCHVIAMIAVLFVTGTEVRAQAWADKMFKDGLVHDFGVVPRGAQLFHKFTITNIYAVKMEITSIRSGCGCVSATSATKILEPKQSTTIDVSMDGRRFNGVKTVALYITVGPEFVSTAELRVTATSRSDVVFNPGQISFGVVSQGQKAEQYVEVEYAGALDWKVTEIVAKDLPVEASIKETYRKPGQVGYQLQVAMKPDTKPGTIKDFIYLKTNDPTSPMISVLVEGTVQSSLTVSPAILALGTVKTEDMLTRRVVVKGSKPFQILGVDGLGDGVELGGSLNKEPAPVQTITFKCAFRQSGDFRKQLMIKTDAQDSPLMVTIEGSANNNP